MRWVVIGSVVLASNVSRADAPAPVNLLSSAPSTVAVSSTVANPKILPEHLVDGNEDRITDIEVLTLGEVSVCRVDHAAAGSTDTTTEIATLAGASRVPVGKRLTFSSTRSEDPANGTSEEGSVKLAAFPLTATETALLVDVTTTAHGPMMNDGTTTSTLYRVSKAGFAPVLDYKSTWSGGEADDSERCELEIGTTRKGLPDLNLVCVVSEGRWHGQDPRGNGQFETSETRRYRWTGSRYEPR